MRELSIEVSENHQDLFYGIRRRQAGGVALPMQQDGGMSGVRSMWEFSRWEALLTSTDQ